MATIKAFTDLSQSKKLAEILPLESADMYYFDEIPHLGYKKETQDFYNQTKHEYLVCWSLTALLGVLPSATLDSSNEHYCRIHCMERFTEWYDNAVDACYGMILKLNELNIL